MQIGYSALIASMNCVKATAADTTVDRVDERAKLQ